MFKFKSLKLKSGHYASTNSSCYINSLVLYNLNKTSLLPFKGWCLPYYIKPYDKIQLFGMTKCQITTTTN